MEANFTPIDIEKLKGEKNIFNTILLIIVTFTTTMLVILLFMLIKKNM